MSDRPAEASGSGAAPPPRLPRAVWVNFVLLALLGVAFLGWASYFTDWLPVALAAVGLGGVLAWPRSLLKWVPALGQRFERGLQAILARRATGAVLLVLLVAGLGLAASVGGVAVASLEDGDRRVDLVVDGETAAARRVEADGRIRQAVWTGLLGEQALTVELAGRPPRPAVVSALERLDLRAPDDFDGRALLVRPARRLAMIAAAPGSDLEWTVRLRDEERRQPFDGHALWVGCTARCELPPERLRAFEALLVANPDLWTRPQELAGGFLAVAAGDVVEVALGRGGREIARRTVRLPSGGSWLHEVEIDAPR